MRAAASITTMKVSLLLAMTLGCSAASDGSHAAMDRSPTIVPLCKLMAATKSHAAKVLEVTGRITATKEGIDMWDPSCSNLGLDLSIDFDVQGVGFKVLEEALKAHGLSDYPVIATVEGTFMTDHYDGIRRQKRTVLVVQKVTDVHRSSAQEHR